MDVQLILESLDATIEQLQQARTLINQASAGTVSSTAIAKDPGRRPLSNFATEKQTGKRKLSIEGRARIAAAQKKRWAKRKRNANVAAAALVAKAPKKASAKTKGTQIAGEATPSKQATPVKRSSGAEKAAGTKPDAAKKRLKATTVTAANKKATSRKKAYETKKNAEAIPDGAIKPLVDVPTATEITEATA